MTNLPPGWSRLPLSEFILLQRGFDLPKTKRRPGAYKVLSSGETSGWHDEGPVEGPGFVIGRATNIGRPTWSDEDYWPLNTVLYAKDFLGNDPKFAYYWFLATDLSAYNSGSVQPMLNRNYIANVPVDAPPLVEQQGIAATLGAFDKKINSNRRQIGLLEELGAAILEKHFHLDAYGFPEYEVGRRLGDVLKVMETGSRPKGGAAASGPGVVSLGAESIQAAGVCNTAAFKRVPNIFATAMRRGHLEEEDVLVYKDGGRPGNFIPHVSAFGYGFPVEEATINEHVYRVRSSGTISQALLYWLLRSPWMDQEMRKRGTGVAIPGLNSSNFRDLPLPVLSEIDVEVLNFSLHPMFKSMLRLGTENRRLAALRDVLLTELLSGRVAVPEAERAAEDAFA
jgi:type I restriction enzyme S subunit